MKTKDQRHNRTLPELPRVGAEIRDPNGVIWSVVGHLDGVATLAASLDSTTRRKITREQYEVWLSSSPAPRGAA